MSESHRIIAAQVLKAFQRKSTLQIVGNGSRLFYGETSSADAKLSLSGQCGIIEYEPSELFVSAKAGTRLAEIEQLLRSRNQMLPFEPPYFNGNATLGGCIACGLSGPGRAAYGSVRDALLGVTMINGRGEILRFGGKVIKNVAGYDVSRLMCGALGTLGVLLEITVRVAPMPERIATVELPCRTGQYAHLINRFTQQGLPVTASFYYGNTLSLRLSGYDETVQTVLQKHFRHASQGDPYLWEEIKEHRHVFFSGASLLWRAAVPPATPTLPAPLTQQASEWNGALRWIKDVSNAAELRDHVSRAGGHADLFYASATVNKPAVFQPLQPALMALHRRIKQAFDPHRILNPGRLYPDL